MGNCSVWRLMMIGAVLAAGPVMAGGDVNSGQQKSATCVGCHGPTGEGVEDNPPLAGLDRESLLSSMRAYKTGENPEPIMGMLMKPLSEEDLADLAAYYASLPGT